MTSEATVAGLDALLTATLRQFSLLADERGIDPRGLRDTFDWFVDEHWFACMPNTETHRSLVQDEAPEQGHYVYRLWQPSGLLLYVGVSTQLRKRLSVHSRKWGHLWDRVTWRRYPDSESMLAAEAAAIDSEDPALNRGGVGHSLKDPDEASTDDDEPPPF